MRLPKDWKELLEYLNRFNPRWKNRDEKDIFFKFFELGECVLSPSLFMEILGYTVKSHNMQPEISCLMAPQPVASYATLAAMPFLLGYLFMLIYRSVEY